MKTHPFRRHLRGAFIPLVCASVLGAAAAHGSFSLSIADAIDASNAISIAPGENIPITLHLVITADGPANQQSSIGSTYSLVTIPVTAGASGTLTLGSRNLSGTSFTDVTITDVDVQGLVLTAANTSDLGGLLVSSEYGNPKGVGSQFLASFVLNSANLTPGATYILRAGTPNSVGVTGALTSVGIQSNDYTVNVVPEPGSALLALGGLGLLALRRRRAASPVE